jgi:hypothetical protein
VGRRNFPHFSRWWVDTLLLIWNYGDHIWCQSNFSGTSCPQSLSLFRTNVIVLFLSRNWSLWHFSSGR